MSENAEILIVDDMPDHIAYAGAILRSEGYRVYAATSGKAALRFLKNRFPDLIILDIKMDGMDGFEVCKSIKLNEDTKDIPIIFLTSETDPNVIRQGFELGCCDYVVKPFTCEEYLARVKTHIDISHKNLALQAANDELKFFCSAVSHDLKAPLNVINMLIESLNNELGDNQSEDIRVITGMISKKSTRLTVMIERLLEFSKMCNVIPEISILNINSIIREVYNDLKMLESDREIELILGDLPEVKGDAVLVKMLIKNLLSNSFKFTSCRQKAVIEISDKSDSEYTIISIRDNGVGFDMAYCDKLFKVFQRLHTSEEYEGSGVGLALADRIMKRHGGKIEAYGEIDNGAEFNLYFLKSQ